MSDIPRRICIDKYTPAETAIRDAMRVVEEAGADPLLTAAVNLLDQAQNKVADYVDRDDPTQAKFIGYPKIVDHFEASQSGGVGARYGVTDGEIAETSAWFTDPDAAVMYAEEHERVFDLVTGQLYAPKVQL